jgi:hypothetical protein
VAYTSHNPTKVWAEYGSLAYEAQLMIDSLQFGSQVRRDLINKLQESAEWVLDVASNQRVTPCGSTELLSDICQIIQGYHK